MSLHSVRFPSSVDAGEKKVIDIDNGTSCPEPQRSVKRIGRKGHLRRKLLLHSDLTAECNAIIKSFALVEQQFDDQGSRNLDGLAHRPSTYDTNTVHSFAHTPIADAPAAKSSCSPSCMSLCSRAKGAPSRALRRLVAWLNGLDANMFDQDFDTITLRLSMSETRALTINTGGLLIGVLSIGAALFTALFYLSLGTWQGSIIPFAYVVVMSSILLLLRFLNRSKNAQRAAVFRVYLMLLALLLIVLPAGVHISVGGLHSGCANGVFGWSILGPLVLVFAGSSRDLSRVMNLLSHPARNRMSASHQNSRRYSICMLY